jgi:hypothetical protein
MLFRFDVHRLPFALTARNPATSRTSTILRGHLVSTHGSGLDVRMGFEDRACETQLAKAAWLLEQAVFQSSLAELQTEKDSMAERGEFELSGDFVNRHFAGYFSTSFISNSSPPHPHQLGGTFRVTPIRRIAILGIATSEIAEA